MTEQTTPPSPPTNPAEAAARLNIRSADPKFAQSVLSGDGPALKEFSDLVAMKSTGGTLDDILAGNAAPVPYETVTGGELSTRNQMTAVADLRAAGLSDAIIKEAFAGSRVSPEIYREAKQKEAALMSDGDFKKKLLAGDHEAVRQFTTLNIVLSGEVMETSK